MLTSANTSSSSIEQSSASKLSFANSSNSFGVATSPTSRNSNSTINSNTGRYSPSNFYRAAAAAAVASDSNNRRYMPSTSVSRREKGN